MPQRQQMFLERRSYRQRRMMDALRLLPVLGLCLCMVPLLWPLPNDQTSPQAGMPMSAALKYLFGVWCLLVLAAWALWRRTRETALADPAGGGTDGSG
jgi:hypothetical protein